MDDEISQRPDKESRRPPRLPRGLTAAVAGLVVVVAVLTVTRSWGHGSGGHDGSGRDSTAASATPADATAPPVSPVPTTPPGSAAAAPAAFIAAGTVLLTCDSASPGRLKPDWRAGSLRVGALWLVGGRHRGYARLGRQRQAHQGRDGRPGSRGVGVPAGHGGPSRDVEMLVHVDAGATVVMRAAAGTSRYFEFLNSPASTGDYQGLDGGRGYTFVPCPAANAGSGGTDFYDVGFSIVPGHAASVEVWTSTEARPVWLTFSTPSPPAADSAASYPDAAAVPGVSFMIKGQRCSNPVPTTQDHARRPFGEGGWRGGGRSGR